MKPTTLWCATVVAACASVPSPSPLAAERLATARALLGDDPSASLRITDDLLQQDPSWRDARLVAAEGSLQLAHTRGAHTDLLLQDAQRDFERGLAGAAEDQEPRARHLLAQCRFELGDFAGAAETALAAARGFTAAGGFDAAHDAAGAMLLAAQCDFRTFVAAREQELAAKKPGAGPVRPQKETALLGARVVAQCERVRREFPAEASTTIAQVCRWLDQHSAAFEELERGIRSAPSATGIHETFIEWMVAARQQDALVGAYTRFVRENPTATILSWYRGRALFLRADQLRADGAFDTAIATYGNAAAAFGEYGATTPAHGDAVNQWRALCALSSARTRVELGDLKGAAADLELADASSPLATQYDAGKPALTDSFGSHYAAVVAAIGTAFAQGGAGALRQTLDFHEAILNRHPDAWAFVANNAALAARDLGVQLEHDGKTDECTALWERAYRHYEKAVQLAPDDARLANDCGLMLVYHLHRDLDRARALFERAIELGEAQLRALPADTAASDRQNVEEAVGDAWQNLAVLAQQQQQPFAAWSELCNKAVRFFPYERREAAAMLRLHDAAATQGGAAETLAKVAADVKKKSDAGDFDGALTLLDAINKECNNHAPYQTLRGELTMQLATQRLADRQKGVELLFRDAVTAFAKAVELDGQPVAPRLRLAKAQQDTGDAEGAVATLSALLLHMQSLPGSKAEDLLAAHTLRANAAAGAYAMQKNDGKDNPELLAAARASFRQLEKDGKLDVPLLERWSLTEQWAGANVEAVGVWTRAQQKNPADAALPFYVGKARYALAGTEREAGKNQDALKTLDLARADFAASQQKNPAFRDSCEQWIAMCLGKKGNIAFWTDDLANAETWLLESVRMRPDCLGSDLGLAETTKLGILRVADKHYQKRDLAKVEAIYRAASDAADKDLDLMNNAGLFARDHGNQLEQAGKQKEALAMYEQSYKAYRRAVQLDRTNVRLRNDCALIPIHYLERDWDESKQLLDAAIADGEKALRENPPGDADEKQKLDEAVGDCWENLALWHVKHDQDGGAAKAAAEKSMEHFPGKSRGGARRHLAAAERLLQGK